MWTARWNSNAGAKSSSSIIPRRSGIQASATPFWPKFAGPDTDPLLVKTGDTISFQLGIAPAKSKFKITMSDPRFFSAAEVADSSTTITVVEAAITTYNCQLYVVMAASTTVIVV